MGGSFLHRGVRKAMKCTILHEGRGRMRVHVCAVRMTLHRADVLEAYLNGQDNIQKATVYERTGDVVLTYRGSRKDAAALLAAYRFDNEELEVLVTSHDSRKINQEYQEKMVSLVAGRVFRKVFLPAPIAAAYTVWRSIAFVWKGIRCLLHRKLEVEVLDALSITASLLRGDYSTAGSVMFLLTVGSLLEEWTRKKSLDDLARSMALNVDKVWVRTPQGEVLVPLTRVHAGDEVVVRSGNMVPLDGTVIEGEAMINQAALTGESMPVRKIEGATVYAGTVVEEGECVFLAKAAGGSNRYDKIVAMIEESEKLKSSTENRALELADKLVPWCLAGTVVTYALTRNVTRAISILMVDFSCALKLSMPLAVLSAMRECGTAHITVKGGKYLEALAKADTIVFDKTGTLTQNKMTVQKVYVDDREYLPEQLSMEEQLHRYLVYDAVLSNDATLENGKGIGDPTEYALLEMFRKIPAPKGGMMGEGGYREEMLRSCMKRLEEVPFDSERKRMSTRYYLHGVGTILTKGAPDVLLERCEFVRKSTGIVPLDPTEAEKIKKKIAEFSGQGLRVLAFAYKESEGPLTIESEENLIFLGLIAMMDPPRPEAIQAVADAKRAGIRTVMITGDHKITARAIAKQLGIYQEGDLAVTGRELDAMSEKELQEKLEKSVYMPEFRRNIR